MKHNLGLVSVTYRQLDTAAVISAAREAGLSCIEWGSDVHVPQTDPTNARAVGEATRAAGLYVSSYGTYYRLGQGQDFAPYLDAAEALGAPILRLWAGVKGSAAVSDDERAACVADARKCADMAAARGLTVAFEYHPNTLTDDSDSAVRLMAEIDRPNARLYWQPDFKKSREELIRGLTLALPYIEVLHVFTWLPSGEKLPLAEGHDFWTDVLRRVPTLTDKKLLLEFVPGNDPAVLGREAAALMELESEVLSVNDAPVRMKAAWVNGGGEAGIRRVYDEETRRELEALFDFYPGVYRKEDILAGAIPDAEALFSTWGMPGLSADEWAASVPDLKIVFYGAGSVQGFARPILARGAKVISAWQANSVPVIEYAAAQIILANKGFYQASRLCSRDRASRGEASKYFGSFRGNYDTAVGLIGLGAIGSGVAQRLREYRLKVYAYDPYCSAEKAASLGVTLESLDFIFSHCLTISNHVANIPATRGMLTYRLFSQMLPNATFINTGRGAQLIEDDLIRALREEPGRTAVLDVTDPEPSPEGHPFYELDNVVLTPHIAGSAGAECFRMGCYMLEEARRYLSGEELKYNVTLKMLETMA